MGNLTSCVSCKIKDKKLQSSLNELALTDYKGANFNQEIVLDAADKSSSQIDAKSNEAVHGATDEDEVKVSVPGESHVTAQELYDAIKNSQRLKGEDYEDDSHLDDIEKAAKAIVDMTVFLTTKVIYPAYLRYLKEDYPDEYSKFIGEEPSSQPGVCPHIDILDLRDVTSCPSCKAEFGAMLPEWAPHQKKERRHSVRFSIVEQTIKADEFDHLDMLRAYQHDPQFYGDFGDSDAAYWADQEEDTEELSPVPESELALEAKDSLTVLNKSYLSPGDISEVLKGLISALQTGDLPSHQVQHVAHMAQELLLNARQSSSPIEKLLDNVPSDTSAMAEEIIMQTITDVQRTLFPEQMTEPGEAFDQITSIAELSQIIVTRAVDLAITNMLDIGTPRTKPRPGSAPAASPSPGLPSDSSTSSTSDFIGNVLERVVNELREEASRTLKKPSETSLFVRNVLSSAALDLRNSKSLDNYVDWDNAPLMKQSSASLTGQLVKDTLYRVAQEIDEEERKAEAVKRRSSTSLFADRLIEETIDNCVEDLKKYGLAHKAEKEFALKKSTSSTSDFVSDILDTVADELREDMNKTMRKQSETSEYVCDILSAAAEDLKNTKSLDNYVEWNDAPLMKYSSKSVTGQMVRDILFKVSKEIDEEEQKVADIESRKRSSTSLFAERLVMDTVQHCLADLQKDNMPKDELLKMASAILKSKASLQSKPAPKPLIHSVSDQGLSQPKIVDATSSTMIAALINETLTRVKLAMEKGSMSTSDVLKLAGGIDTSSLPTAALKTEESIHAEKLVADILQEAERRIPVKSASSMEGEQLVSDVIRTQIESTEVDEPGWVPDKDMQIELNENAKRSDTSVEADNLVSSIIDAVAQGASSLTKTVAPAQNIPPTTAESEEAEAAVKVAISEASLKIRQLSLPATLSQTAQMLVQEAIDNILENPDLITQLNTSVTDVAIHSSLSKVIKDSLSQVLINHNIQGSKMQIVNETEEEPAQPASTADEPASGILDHGFEHVIIKSEHVDDDSSDEETEVSVRPVIGHTPLHIDHHLVENALSILSVKKDVDIIEHHENLAARNSFADLMHPDIKGIARFNEESENSACKKFMTMSKHCIALPPAVEKQGVSKSADTAVVRETMTERKIRYSVDEDEQLMKVVNIHQAESLEDIHAQSCGGRKAPSVASVPHSYKPLETKTSEEKIVPKKPSKQSVHQISPKTSGTSVSKPSIVKSPYAQSMKGKGTPKASPSVSHATRPGAKPIGATSVPAVRSINQVTSVPKGSKSLSLSKESVKPASKQSSKGSDLHKKATSITNIEKSSDASQPITQDPTDIVDTPTSNLDPSCSKDSLKDAGGPPTDLTGETLAENENPDTFDEEAFASHFPGSLESGLPCSSSSDPDVSEASGQTSEVLGRDSPVAQTVDEEELPVRMKSIRKHGVSDIHVARVRDTSKQVRSASSTALMMHKKRLGSIDQGTPSDKQSVTRTSVAASSSKFFKAMSLSSRASKLAAAASKTGSMQSSHKMVNLTPRPSSGYSKSPTPASVANAAKSKQQIHIESKPEDDEPQEPKQGSYKDILKQRLDVSPKQSIMSLTELTVADSSSNQDLSKKLEEALSDTSCTHSESDYKQIKSIDEIMTPEAGEAEEKTSTSSLPKEDDMITHRISKHQHILLKQKHTDEDD